jgi:hypothetical protein
VPRECLGLRRGQNGIALFCPADNAPASRFHRGKQIAKWMAVKPTSKGRGRRREQSLRRGHCDVIRAAARPHPLMSSKNAKGSKSADGQLVTSRMPDDIPTFNRHILKAFNGRGTGRH